MTRFEMHPEVPADRYPVTTYVNEPYLPGRVLPGSDLPEVTGTRCARCRETSVGRCAVHGCAYCQAEVEAFALVEPCPSCFDLREQTYAATVALSPAWVCEQMCAVQHCDDCGECGQSGRVCRECGLCLTCASEDEFGPCSVTRWDRLLRREVTTLHHSLYNPRTQRWDR